MARLTGTLLAALAVVATVAETVDFALADGDPASDVLLQQDYFLPYQPPVCAQLKNALAQATLRSDAAGYRVKVAVIESPTDLGLATTFFGRPAAYADFLGRELRSFSPHLQKQLTGVPLVVVMPQGIALFQASDRANQAVKGIAVSSSADSNALTRAAVKAVPAIAAAAGHPIKDPPIASGCSHKKSTTLLFVLPILLVLAAVLLMRFRRPRTRAS